MTSFKYLLSVIFASVLLTGCFSKKTEDKTEEVSAHSSMHEEGGESMNGGHEDDSADVEPVSDDSIMDHPSKADE